MKASPVQIKILQLGWSQSKLVSQTGWDKRRISDIVKGKYINPAIQEDIAEIIGVPIKWLFGKWAWTQHGKKGTHKRKTKCQKSI